jgi:hypothetical protein
MGKVEVSKLDFSSKANGSIVRDFLETKSTVSAAAVNRNLCRSPSGIYPFSDFGEECIIRKNHAIIVGYDFRHFKGGGFLYFEY